MQDGRAFAAKVGVDVVDEVTVDLYAPDAKTQLLNMRNKGAEYAIINETYFATATILKDARALGIITKFFGLMYSAGEDTLALAGAAAEGYYGAVPFSLIRDEYPGLREVQIFNTAKGKDWTKNSNLYVQGWTAMLITAEGIRRAGDDITGQSVKAGLERIWNFDTGGITAPITFTSQSHKGANKTRIYQVKSGRWVPVTDLLQAPE
jgi:branched-chain amino acid transport system substrate-binding protein